MYVLLTGLSVIEASSFVALSSAGLYCVQMDQIGDGSDYRRWPVTAGNDPVPKIL